MGRALIFRKTSGLTLSETLVALSLLIVVMLAVLNLFPSAVANVRLTRTGWLARTAAQNVVEEVAARPFGSLVVGDSTASDISLSDGTKAHITTTVGAVGTHPPRFVKAVRCEISWPGRGTTKRAVQEVYVHGLRR